MAGDAPSLEARVRETQSRVHRVFGDLVAVFGDLVVGRGLSAAF
jgi:hypothetical protein